MLVKGHMGPCSILSAGSRQLRTGVVAAAPRLTTASTTLRPALASRARAQPLQARHRNKSSNGTKQHAESESGGVMNFNQLFQGGKKTRSSPCAKTTFCLTRQLEFGQGLKLAGSADVLGGWDHTKGPDLQWHEGHRWSVQLSLPTGVHDFKFVLVHRSGHLEWEAGDNRHIAVPVSAAELQVVGHWGHPEDTDVLELQQHASYRKALKAELAAQQAEQDALDAALLEEQRQAAQQRQAAAVAALEAAPVIFSAEQLAGAQELPAVPAALDWTQLDTSVPENALLVQVLQGFKHDVLEGLSGVTNAVQEIQEELSVVQQQVASLSAVQLAEQQHNQEARARRAAEAPPGELGLPFASDAGDDDVLSLREEFLTFKEDTAELRHEMEDLRVSLQSQIADNTAAVHDLELLVKHVMNTSGGAQQPPPASWGSNASATAASDGWTPSHSSNDSKGESSGGGRGGGRGGGGSGGGTAVAEAPQVAEVLDAEDRQLLERINFLASDLSTEMKTAVHELELQQQTLLQRHSRIAAERPGSPLAGPAASSIGTMLPVAARWLESREAPQFYEGLLVTVMLSCGLWADGLDLAEPLRATYAAYKATWGKEALQAWCDGLHTRKAVVDALSAGNTQLCMHMLWSVAELSTQSQPVQQALTKVGTSIELGLMQKLRTTGGASKGWALGVSGAPAGGGGAAAAAQCAVVLQRWLASESKQRRH